MAESSEMYQLLTSCYICIVGNGGCGVQFSPFNQNFEERGLGMCKLDAGSTGVPKNDSIVCSK